MTDSFEEQARAEIASHGPRAHQAVVDRMVAAIRQEDDAALADLAQLLRTVERLQRDERQAIRSEAEE